MDRYSLNARIYPIIIFYMPAIILVVLFSLKFENYVHLFSSFGIIGALSYLFSQISRDAGKKREKALWDNWDGAPTTQILRWRNTLINKNTKKRYHDKLMILCPVNNIPNENFELIDPVEADEIYKTWIKFLISKTRDTNRFSVLFKDNMNYGFRRNLWGLKLYAIIFILILIIGTYTYYTLAFKDINPIFFPKEFMIAESILIIIFFFWLAIIKKNWIKIPAFSYAERLLESIEEIDN